MTVREASKGVYSRYHGTYDIDFINDEGETDETQFDNVRSLQELSDLYREFCKENGYKANTVVSIVPV